MHMISRDQRIVCLNKILQSVSRKGSEYLQIQSTHVEWYLSLENWEDRGLLTCREKKVHS